MSYATAREIEASEIPVIDAGPLLAREPGGAARVAAAMRDAAETVGFFYVSNHGIPDTVIEDARAASRRFFAQPMEAKLEVEVNDRHRGFLAVGQARMRDDVKSDLKESFVWGIEVEADDPGNAFHAKNRWPAAMPEFRAGLYPWLEAGNALGRELLRAFAVAMDLPEDSFVAHYRQPISRASVVYYPPQTPDMGADQFGVGPHTDYGCLTVLCQDSVGGLQVQNKAGEWVTAHPIAGTLVINVGDLLARWTNDGFASTPHRVVNTSGLERYSLVVAVDPDVDTVVDPAIACRAGEAPAYEPTTVGAYIQSRFDASFSYRK